MNQKEEDAGVHFEKHNLKLPSHALASRYVTIWNSKDILHPHDVQTVHGVLTARIPMWFAIPFSSGPCFVRVGDGQGSLACCRPWGLKELDATERLNWCINPFKHLHSHLFSIPSGSLSMSKPRTAWPWTALSPTCCLSAALARAVPFPLPSTQNRCSERNVCWAFDCGPTGDGDHGSVTSVSFPASDMKPSPMTCLMAPWQSAEADLGRVVCTKIWFLALNENLLSEDFSSSREQVGGGSTVVWEIALVGPHNELRKSKEWCGPKKTSFGASEGVYPGSTYFLSCHIYRQLLSSSVFFSVNKRQIRFLTG